MNSINGRPGEVQKAADNVDPPTVEEGMATVAEVLRASKESENADIAYVISLQLNCMIEANKYLRGSYRLQPVDVQVMFRMMEHLLRAVK